MPLTPQQKTMIVDVDKQVKAILDQGGDEETLLVNMLPSMPGIKTIIDSALGDKEIDMYVQAYDGFYHYMKVLERLAQRIANGDITVPR